MALSFLTVFPTPGKGELTQRDISSSRAYYPLIGLLLGLVLAGLEWAGSRALPPVMTAAVLIAFLIGVTRGLHLDGFMDVCDGLFGGYTRERRLEIMRDSNVGAFAVAGAGALLLLKYGALVSVLSFPAQHKLAALVLFPVVSRWSMVVLLGAFPYARGSGLGSPFHQGGGGLATTVAAVVGVAAAIVIGGVAGISILGGVSVFAFLIGKVVVRLLGGLTGDVYGATNELTEVLVLIAAVAIIPHGFLGPMYKVIW